MSNNTKAPEETLLPLSELAKEIPGRRGKGVMLSTVWRWSHRGVRLSDGTVVRLEFQKVGGRVHSTREAVSRFLAAIDADAKAGLAQAVI